MDIRTFEVQAEDFLIFNFFFTASGTLKGFIFFDIWEERAFHDCLGWEERHRCDACLVNMKQPPPV